MRQKAVLGHFDELQGHRHMRCAKGKEDNWTTGSHVALSGWYLTVPQ
jgi:hypothetical protein